MCRYVTKHFNEDAKHSMNEMVKDIRAEMEKILQNLDWMDDMTRERAKDKLRTMKEYIGYPEEILQEHLLEELYEVPIHIAKHTDLFCFPVGSGSWRRRPLQQRDQDEQVGNELCLEEAPGKGEQTGR